MIHNNISETLKRLARGVIKANHVIVIALVLTFALVTAHPAQAQAPGDTWKSIAIIGGSTAAGAIIGHKVAGTTGAYVGAAAGAATGYAIDRHRRNNEYNNGYYGGNYYPSNGPYGNYYPYSASSNNSGYYGNQPVYNGGYQGSYNARYRRR